MTHPTAKLCPKRYGPFKITEIIGSTTYRLELPPQWCIHNAFHASLLLPYQETPEHGRNFEEPPPDLVEGQPEWEVEKILQERMRRGKKQYLIRWKGYSEAHDSWEPKANLNAPELLQAFHQRHKKVERALKAVLIDCAQGAKAKDQKGNPVKDQKGNPKTAERRPMRIRSLRMQESEGMTSESSSPPHLSSTRPSELEGNTLTSPSLAEKSNRSQTLSGTITPAHTLREAGLHRTSATSESSLPEGTLTPPPSRALASASSSTVPTAAFAPDEDRAPLAARQCILDDLVDLLLDLSISEGNHPLRFLQASPVPPTSTPTTSVSPAALHAPRDASLGGRVPPELPAANGTTSPVSGGLGSHSESNAPAQRRERGRGSRRRATRRGGHPYPERSSEGGSAASSPEAQSLISSRRSEASSTGVSRATSRIPERPLLTVPEVAIIASDSPPPSHSLLPLPFDISAFFAEHPPPAAIGADDPVGDALGIVLHAVATADPLVSPSRPPPEPSPEPPRATHYREPLPTTPAPPGVDYYRRNHYRDHPGPEWYPYRPDQHFSRLTIPDEEGRQVEAKYLSVRVVQGEPTIMGTMGYGQPVHSESLHALPFAAPAPAHFHLPSFSILQNPFDPRTE